MSLFELNIRSQVRQKFSVGIVRLHFDSERDDVLRHHRIEPHALEHLPGMARSSSIIERTVS